jgi:hypothetical protein
LRATNKYLSRYRVGVTLNTRPKTIRDLVDWVSRPDCLANGPGDPFHDVLATSETDPRKQKRPEHACAVPASCEPTALAAGLCFSTFYNFGPTLARTAHIHNSGAVWALARCPSRLQIHFALSRLQLLRPTLRCLYCLNPESIQDFLEPRMDHRFL